MMCLTYFYCVLQDKSFTRVKKALKYAPAHSALWFYFAKEKFSIFFSNYLQKNVGVIYSK